MWILIRLFYDFWPLDKSTVGPNILASVVLGVLAVLYAEFRLLKRIRSHHEATRKEFHDAIEAALHPSEHVEEHVAQDVVQDIKEDDLGPK